jgi:hypothetical protein
LDSISGAVVGWWLTHPKWSQMQREYDLFEISSDGGLMWREMVAGRENAVLKLNELSKKTSHEIRVMHVLTNTVIASTKGSRA